MYYGDYEDFSSAVTKTIKVHKNGDRSVNFELKLGSEYNERDIGETIETKLRLKPVQTLRLFTADGLELSIKDLHYLKSGETIFASRGENFDRSSTLSEYEIVKVLGEGGFGRVEKAIHKDTGEAVAIKFLKADRVIANDINKLFSEAETLKSLRHKNIVRVDNCFSPSSTQVAFIMEYLDGGELLEYVLAREKLSEDEAREFFRQIVEAVSYCHRNKLIHCDLKLENILLESKESKVVKVVDFGISGLCTGQKMNSAEGSLDYMAPEYFNGSNKGVHPGVDVWALGCMLYGMVCGKLPFSGGSNEKVIERICHAKIEYGELGKKLTNEIKHLISRMLDVDPDTRILVYDILDHPWMIKEKLPESQEEEMKDDQETKASSKDSTPSSRLNKKPIVAMKNSSFVMGKSASPTVKRLQQSNTMDKSPKVVNVTPASQPKKSENFKLVKK